MTAVVTPIGSESYTFQASPGSMTVSSPVTNTSGNLRMLFRSSDAPIVTNQMSCMVISSQSATYNQQGVALRIRSVSGGTQAILVTKGIYPSPQTFINVHVFDSTAPSTLTQIGGFDYTPVFGNYFQDPADPNYRPQEPLPWNVCAKVEAATVRVKAWRGNEAQPAWDDGDPHNRRVDLPAGATWVFAGQAGWFVGHLTPGQSTSVTGLATTSLG